MLIEGWSPWDAFYMTVITITTVGYGEVHPLSRAGPGVHGRHSAQRRRRGLLRVHAVHGAARRGGPAEAAAAHGGTSACSTNSRTTSSSAATAASARSSRASSRGSSVPFVVIERNPERMQAAMEAGLPGRRGRRHERGCPEARRHRARARPDRRGRHRRRERLCGAERARAAAGPVHRRPRRDRGRARRSCSAPAPIASSRRIRSAACRSRRRRCGRRSSTSCSSRRTSDNLDLKMEQVHIGAGLAARRPDAGRRRSAAAVRRDRGRHPARPTAGWSSIPGPRRRCAPATSSSCSAAAGSLKELEATAAGGRIVSVSAYVRCRRGCLNGSGDCGGDSRGGDARVSRRSPRAPAARPVSASCWSATIRRRRSTSATR